MFSNIKPPVFNGSTEIKTWIATFDVYATAGRWTDMMRFAAVADSLQGLPKRIFDQHILVKGVRPWNEIKDDLMLIFGNTQNKSIALERLNKRLQKDFEPIERYFYDKLSLINEVDSKMIEEQKISLIVSGLNRFTKSKYFDFILASPQQPNDTNELFGLLKKMSDVQQLMDPRKRYSELHITEDNKSQKPHRINQTDKTINYLVNSVKELKMNSRSNPNKNDYQRRGISNKINVQTKPSWQNRQTDANKTKQTSNAPKSKENITCFSCQKK